MSKQKLPKNWIVLNSKSHPDRVYYFNVKTNQSSWEQPTGGKSEQIGKRVGESEKKRKKSEEEPMSVPFKPSTPEHDSPVKGNTKRRTLTARRTIHHIVEKTNEEKETPQMKALREKMLKKKEKTIAPKVDNSGPIKDDTKSSLSSSSSRRKSMLSTSETSISEKKEVYTPQMKAIFEKMQQKAAKSTSKVKKVENNNKLVDLTDDVNDKKENQVKVRQTRSQIAVNRRKTIADFSQITQSESATSDTNDSPEGSQEKCKTGPMSRTTVRKRSVDNISHKSTPIKKNRRTGRKNMAKKRMEELQRSLTLESNDESIEHLKSPLNDAKSPIETNKYDAPPNIYKNVQVRLVRLNNRLSKCKTLLNEKLNVSQLEEPEKSGSESNTTLNDLIKQSVDTSLYEEMDWEPMEDDKITFEVQAVRTQLCGENVNNISSNVLTNTLKHTPPAVQQEKKQMYIVVDTNVFLSNIEAIDLAMEAVFRSYDRPIIVIPWTVIRELDYIKSNNNKTKSASLSAKARRAVNYINNLFSSKHPRIMGQTPEDVAKNKEKFAIDCPDDEILQTCLQLRDFEKSVVLLSYDKNLCNKAMVYDIVTLGRNDPIEKIDYLDVTLNESAFSSFSDHNQSKHAMDSRSILHQESHISSEMLENAKSVIKEFLSVIVSKEMQSLYGEKWERHVIRRPPWTAITVLQCAIKHWIAAVSESFLRKAEITLKELLTLFKSYPGNGWTLKEVNHVLDKCSDLIQMVNVDKHPRLMLESSQKIDEMKKTCQEYMLQMNEIKLQDEIGVEEDAVERERRAQKAFQYFETAYVYARDMCGLAAEAAGMPCSFHHNIPNPLPPLDYVKQIQPELAANVNRLLHNLSAVIEQVDVSCIDHRTLTSLYQTLVTFLPESTPMSADLINCELTPLDIYCCVKQKEEVLKTGLRQLQELSTHFCKLASFRCT